jgi:hypothetical protein
MQFSLPCTLAAIALVNNTPTSRVPEPSDPGFVVGVELKTVRELVRKAVDEQSKKLWLAVLTLAPCF